MSSPRGRTAGPGDARLGLGARHEAPPPALFRRGVEPRRRWGVALACGLSALLLTVSFAPFDCWIVAYVALVPWMLALGAARGRWAILSATGAGLLFWLGNLYWLWWITLVGYFALVAYLTVYWLVVALVLRAAYRRNWPMWLTLPVVWTALEYARAHIISGFPWFFLAHSQYARTTLIQIADVTGQYGLSFFVAMVNGAIVDSLSHPLLRRRGAGPVQPSRHVLGGVVASAVVAAGLVGYGLWRLGQDATKPGPVVGIVQQAFPITLHGRDCPEEEILEVHLGASAAFFGAGCDLVIWPEAMLPTGLNEEFLGLDERLLTPEGQEALRETQDLARRVVRLSEQLGCPLLAGGVTLHRNFAARVGEPAWLQRNSALWFDGLYPWASRYYAKMHLVPFGEYVPFRQSWPWLHRLLRRFVPEVMQQLDPGPAVMVFELERAAGRWTLAVPICYEGTFGDVCRQLVMQGGRKRADILVNLSNDGWFVWKWGQGPYRGSTEHAQHLAQYCFRAVECRTPVVRAVNTGISASIDSRGRIVALLGGHRSAMAIGTLVLDGARSQGAYVPGHGPKVLVDRRTSLYSVTGDVFASAVALVGAVITAGILLGRPKAGRKGRQ